MTRNTAEGEENDEGNGRDQSNRRQIVAYLDTSKPGDPRNEKVIKTLAQFDADMAKAYAEREVNIKREFAKIEKERKEHRKNQMTILYKKYVDAAQAEKKEKKAQAEKKAQKTEGVKPPELSMTDQGWNIL